MIKYLIDNKVSIDGDFERNPLKLYFFRSQNFDYEIAKLLKESCFKLSDFEISDMLFKQMKYKPLTEENLKVVRLFLNEKNINYRLDDFSFNNSSIRYFTFMHFICNNKTINYPILNSFIEYKGVFIFIFYFLSYCLFSIIFFKNKVT
jgi:hypothetical protein